MAMTSEAFATDVIAVKPVDGDTATTLQQAIHEASARNGKQVTIKLSPGNYTISRECSSRHLHQHSLCRG